MSNHTVTNDEIINIIVGYKNDETHKIMIKYTKLYS